MTETIRCGKFFEAFEVPGLEHTDLRHWRCNKCETEGEEDTAAAIHHLYKTAHTSCRKAIS